MNKFFIILVFFAISCKKNVNNLNETSKADEDFNKKQDSRFDYFLDYKKIGKGSILLDKIRIVEKKLNKSYQIIDLKKNSIELPENISYFMIKDVNFDGINDIQIVNFVGAYTSTSSFWIFNKNQFVHVKSMDEIQNPVILKDKKEICSYWHSGLSEFHLEKYFWDKNSILLKENYEELWHHSTRGTLSFSRFEEDKWLTTTKEIKARFVESMKCE